MAEEGDSSSAFEVLERDYQDTLKDLSGSNAAIVEPFRAEYEKLFKALQKSHESEKRLIKKCRDLNSDITANAASVQTAMKLSQEDQQQIAMLRREIDGQQKLVAQSQQKEAQAKEMIARYKADINDLTARIEAGAGMTPEQEAQINQLVAQKEQLEKERDIMKSNLEMLQKIGGEVLEKVHKSEQLLVSSEEDIRDVKAKLAEKRAEIEVEKRRKEELEQQMKDLRHSNELHQEEVINAQRGLAGEEADLRKIGADIEETEKECQQLEARVRAKMDEKRTLEQKLEQEVAKNSKYIQENLQRELTVREKKDETQRSYGERDKTVKLLEGLKKKERALDDERKDLEGKRNELKLDLKTNQEKLDQLRHDGDSDRKKIEDLLRERDILNKNVIKADERTRKQIDLVKRQETQAMNLQKDIARWKQDAQEFKKRIFELEKQREKYGIELSQANSKYFAALEELKTRDARLTELKKQIADVQAKRNQQKNLYDAVCMDRNLHAKNLIESNEQIAEMRRKFKMMFHQTTGLKEEIREKDTRLVRGHFKHKRVQQLNEKLKDAKEKANRRMRNLTNIVETQRIEIKKLESTIQEAEQEWQAQQKELDAVIGERDILGGQLIRRNEELALLYEKIKIQQSTLTKGENQFRERQQEINATRAEIRKFKEDLNGTKQQVVNVDALKKEIYHLHTTLLREETKAKALQEELENPMNVHRWRELEGSDPATYEMIQKVKSLQKLLIAKTEEVVEKDMLIQEKEKLYVQLKNVLARQPGPEVAEQLAWYSQNLKEKTAHMKQMVGELKNYHTQCRDLKDEIARYNKELAQIKQNFFQGLRRQQAYQQQQMQMMQESQEGMM
eukprot:gnl/TRDRNA2_/TRDRNA2_180945_c0_seq1.p1 gnl/TRDRNA2_/TRDRNA2_180945_c0~~gnl/TRDRNA2_/TRDRNA2_180945_c0_seq1.p1  ORF type:complete len:877 (+),score=320.21 gnl/TRDRNA2_/TRDRNA2_180945_c0_seq1:83-2632(+)